MKRKLERLKTLPENQRRAELAELRHGIGHAPGMGGLHRIDHVCTASAGA